MKTNDKQTLEVCVLASSSKANATVIQSGTTRILIDCGLSLRELGKRLAGIGWSPSDIEAVVLTHEHSDHIKGLPRFIKQNRVPVYMTEGTWQDVHPSLGDESDLCRVIDVEREFSIGEVTLFPFAIQHDAREPVGFRITAGGLALGFATDLGQVTEEIKGHLEGMDVLIIESNHDPELLKEAPYPWDLKRRIEGAYGHLSNNQAGELLEHLSLRDYARLQVVIAAHVSENSNCPELVLETLREHWNRSCRGYQPVFAAACSKTATELFRIRKENEVFVEEKIRSA
ncbi:MAG: MBL fold metallo-hydrolase [Bdellovibrionales bacterium]|nr:MBL fold metallo-hydrolase [Bdellovibrionales bacterium]